MCNFITIILTPPKKNISITQELRQKVSLTSDIKKYPVFYPHFTSSLYIICLKQRLKG